MKSLTWTRQSHGLFDYESKSIKKKDLKATSSGTLIRRGDAVSFVTDGIPEVEDEESEEQTVMFDLKHEDRGKGTVPPYLSANLENDTNDRLWLVIRSLKEKGYQIQRNDIIKLGRMKFRIKEFRTSKEYFNAGEDLESEFCEVKQVEQLESKESEDKMCRVCWMDGMEEDNPLVSPCSCTGSVKYIHFNCLQKWLLSKMTCKEGQNHQTLSWKQFECDLCKDPFSYCFKFGEKLMNIVEMDKPQDESTPYIILESLSIGKNSSRVVHLVKASDGHNKFTLGRGHESDLRINDISVSRLHAYLNYSDDIWNLVDCRSKFGTLALHQGNLDLELDKPRTLQIGRTVVTIYPKKSNPWVENLAQGAKSKNGMKDLAALRALLKDSESSGNRSVLPQELQNRQQILEVDGKRYLVLQELPPEDQEEDE